MEEILTRAWTDLLGRSAGLMSFRIVLQPTVAIGLAIRAGLVDAREGRPPFLWNIRSSPGRRRELLRTGWKDVGTVFAVALILDSIYQVIVHSAIYPLELLITATVLALVPYALIRGPVTRIARRRRARAAADREPATTGKPNEHPRPEETEN